METENVSKRHQPDRIGERAKGYQTVFKKRDNSAPGDWNNHNLYSSAKWTLNYIFFNICIYIFNVCLFSDLVLFLCLVCLFVILFISLFILLDYNILCSPLSDFLFCFFNGKISFFFFSNQSLFCCFLFSSFNIFLLFDAIGSRGFDFTYIGMFF